MYFSWLLPPAGLTASAGILGNHLLTSNLYAICT